MPQTQSCRWVWCRETFSGSAALNDHIIAVHVNRNSVRRSDIPTLKQLEEASSKSFDIIPKALSSNPSSLPSPPISSPLSPHSALQSSPRQDEQSISHVAQPNSQRTDDYYPSLHLNNVPGPSAAFTPLKNAVEPTFASLSSPADSRIYSPIIPKSPDLSKMIYDAIHDGDATAKHYTDDSPSSSSSSSRDSVEKQLVQRKEDCSPRSDKESSNAKTESAKDATQSQIQTHSVGRQSTYTLQNHASPHVRKQTWYQGVRKSHSRTSRPSRARRMVTVVGSSRKFSQLDSSPGSGASSTPEWPLILQEEGHNSHPFPYQTQPSYDSQPTI